MGWITQAVRTLRDPAVAIVALACLVIAGMYACNDDMGGDPKSPRGDGRYRPVLARGDGHMMFLMSRSMVYDRDWHFDNDLARFGDPWGQPRTATGRKGIPHPIGPPLVWAPVLAMAEGGARAGNVFGADIPEHGYALWHQRIVFFTSVLAGCGAVLIGLLVARRVLGGRWAPSHAAVAVLLGTSVTYYSTVMPSYGHALDALACAGFLGYWALTVGREDPRRHVILGVLLGVAALIRVQELAIGVALAVELGTAAVTSLVARRPRAAAAAVGRGLLTLAVALVCFIPQLVMWRVVFGTFNSPQGEVYIRWGTPMIAELLWSARNGWLAVTPVAYLGVVGLCLVPRRHRVIGAGLLAAVIVQIYLNSIIMDWWAQASFGQRRLCSMTLPLVVGLAALLGSMGRLAARARRVPWPVWHGVAALVLGPMIAWNLWRVDALGGGKPAPTTHAPSCCDRVPRPLRGLFADVYGVLGNPLQLPASAVFAWRHDTSLARWDQAVGDYPIILRGDLMMNGRWREQRGTWNLAGGGGAPYLLEGFGPTQHGERPFRRTTARRARALVPNLIPAAQRFTVWLEPGPATRVRLHHDGVLVADVALRAGWQPVIFERADPPTGSIELSIEADVPGVAVGVVEVGFVSAAP